MKKSKVKPGNKKNHLCLLDTFTKFARVSFDTKVAKIYWEINMWNVQAIT